MTSNSTITRLEHKIDWMVRQMTIRTGSMLSIAVGILIAIRFLG
jgi:hypothetical protein